MVTDPIHIQKALERDGYFFLSSAIDNNCLDAIANYIDKNPIPDMDGFYTSIWLDDQQRRKNDFDAIIAAVWPVLNPIFSGYVPIMANFVVKQPQKNSRLGLHQDWNFTDEKKYPSFNIWFPLNDVNDKDGPLKIIRHSHKIWSGIRGKNIEQLFERGNDFLKKRYTQTFFTKKGDAVIFNTKNVHYSEDNISNRPRIGISVVIVSENAELYHYYKRSRESKKIFCIKVDTDYYWKYSLKDLPEQEPIEIIRSKKINAWKRYLNISIIFLYNLIR